SPTVAATIGRDWANGATPFLARRRTSAAPGRADGEWLPGGRAAPPFRCAGSPSVWSPADLPVRQPLPRGPHCLDAMVATGVRLDRTVELLGQRGARQRRADLLGERLGEPQVLLG